MATGRFFFVMPIMVKVRLPWQKTPYTMKLANYYMASLKELETKIELEHVISRQNQ